MMSEEKSRRAEKKIDEKRRDEGREYENGRTKNR